MLGKAQPDLTRTGTKLFDKSHNDRKRKFDRTVLSAICLKKFEDALIGTSGKVSALKMLKVVGSAAGCDTHGESEFEDLVLRIAVRDKKMKMTQYEVSNDEDEYAEDATSNCTEPPSQHSDYDSDADPRDVFAGIFVFPLFK